MSDTSYNINLPVAALIDQLMKGFRLVCPLGTSVEHIAPFARYMSPRLEPQRAAEIEHTFLLCWPSVGNTLDGRGPIKVFYTAQDAIWGFLRAIGGIGMIQVEAVPTEETDALTLMAMKEGLLENCRVRSSERIL